MLLRLADGGRKRVEIAVEDAGLQGETVFPTPWVEYGLARATSGGARAGEADDEKRA